MREIVVRLILFVGETLVFLNFGRIQQTLGIPMGWGVVLFIAVVFAMIGTAWPELARSIFGAYYGVAVEQRQKLRGYNLHWRDLKDWRLVAERLMMPRLKPGVPPGAVKTTAKETQASAAVSVQPAPTEAEQADVEEKPDNDALWADAAGSYTNLSSFLDQAIVPGSAASRLFKHGYPDEQHPIPPLGDTHPEVILHKLVIAASSEYAGQQWCDPMLQYLLNSESFVRKAKPATNKRVADPFKEIFGKEAISRLCDLSAELDARGVSTAYYA